MDVEELRKVMGTSPKEKTELKTEFFEGVRGIKVQLLDYPVNPYKAVVDMACSTWGDKIDKWPSISLENRFNVVKAVLEFKSLPNAMESASFTFAIEGCSRSAFDQIVRTRIGFVASSMGWRDNDHSDIGFRVPQSIWNNPESLEMFRKVCLAAKKAYHEVISQGQSSWQDARAFLPISACHSFSMAMNYMALRNFCNKRLKFCEQADTVAVAWLVREAVKEVFPLLASYLRPSCDWKKQCEYHQEYYMSEVFGCLFKECGRNPCKAKDNYAQFNFSCSDKNLILKQLGIFIPDAGEDLPKDYYDDLARSDKELFES